MKRTLAALIAAAFLTTSGLAAAQRIDTETSTGWVGDEPNTLEAGTNPNAWDDSPSAAYPADANGLGDGRGPDGSFAPILAVNFVHGPPVVSPGAVADADGASARLLAGLLGESTILPGTGQFQAYLGTFQDLNGDGWITEGNHFYDRAHVNTRSDGSCTSTTSTTDDHGIGETLPTGEATDTHVSVRCVGADEFFPAAAGSVIVAYVTPGQWNGGSDFVNRWFAAWNPLTPPAPPSPENPDFQFKGFGTEGENTGRSYSPDTNFQYTMVDNSLLETLTLEAISSPVTQSNGARTQEAGPDSLVEVDNYVAVNPALETLYRGVTFALGDAGCNPDLPERGCRDTTDPATEPVRLALGATDATVGPVVGQVVTRWEQNPNGLDYADPHLFLDLFWDTSLAVGAGVSFNDNNIVAGVSPYSNAQLSPTADGSPHAWPQISIMGYFGVWEDKNADGWIGRPATSAGCADAYNCGNKPWPHEYPQNIGSDAHGEFTVACGDKEIGGGQVAGSFPVTLTPSGGVWGATGVYVLTDRKDVRNANADTFRDDGRNVFIPYDDIALDVADDGQVDALVLAGDITLGMVCRDQNGFYYSFERLVFPTGTNVDYDITVTGGTGGNFVTNGVPVGERVTDTDVIARAA